MPRASSRFATFAQAISSTNPTAPRRSHRPAIVSFDRKLFCRASTLAVHPLFDRGLSSAMRAVTWSMLALACASETPGFKRPMTSSQWKSWLICSGLKLSGL
jgi:hypothetical protein